MVWRQLLGVVWSRGVGVACDLVLGPTEALRVAVESLVELYQL